MRRVRETSDRDFYVFMIERDTKRRISVGLFWGRTAEQAIEQARAKYPKLFKSAPAPAWSIQAQQVNRRIEH